LIAQTTMIMATHPRSPHPSQESLWTTWGMFFGKYKMMHANKRKVKVSLNIILKLSNLRYYIDPVF